MCFVFFLHFLVCTGPGSVLNFFSFVLCSLVSSVPTCFNLVVTLSLGFVGLFFSEIILGICELLLSLLGICLVMQCNYAITCVLASPSLLFSGGIKSKETLYWEKKNCVREMTVEVRFLSGHHGCYLWISRDYPYNRGGCNVDSIPLE